MRMNMAKDGSASHGGRWSRKDTIPYLAITWIYRLSMLLLCVFLFVFATMETPTPPQSQATRRQLLQGRKILIAANYFENVDILEDHTNEMARLLTLLQEAGAEPYVSVYENGSKDATPARLRVWGGLLEVMGVPHSIDIDTSPSWHDAYEAHRNEHRDSTESKVLFRIRFMATVRNRALHPLQLAKFDDILFFNDVLFNADDALRLLLTYDLRYDVACAMDFNRVTLYDTWVARDVNGERMAAFYPYTADEESIELLRQGKPFPVSSCWNGVVAMKAGPFRHEQVRFRAWNASEPRLVSRPRFASKVEGQVYSDDCPASECGLIFEDLAALGHANVYMHPTVHVTYRHVDRMLHRVVGGALSTITWWLLSIRPHPRIPPQARLAECGLERPLVVADWVVYAGLLVFAVFVGRVWRRLRRRTKYASE